nr:MAG TPA: hypothetical protein [Bacteriophage sp.]
MTTETRPLTAPSVKPHAPILSAERTDLCACRPCGLLCCGTHARIEITCESERACEHTVHHCTLAGGPIIACVCTVEIGLILKVCRLLQHIIDLLTTIVEAHACLLVDRISCIRKSRRSTARGSDPARSDCRPLLSHPQERPTPFILDIDLVVLVLPFGGLLRLVRIHLRDLCILFRLSRRRFCLRLLCPPLHPRGKERSHHHCRYTHIHSLLFEKLEQMIRQSIEAHRLRLMNNRAKPPEPCNRRIIPLVDIVIEIFPVMQKRADSFARLLARIDFMLRRLRSRKHPDDTVPKERICLNDAERREDHLIAVTGVRRRTVIITAHDLRFDIWSCHTDDLATILRAQMCGKISEIVIRRRMVGKLSHPLPPPAQWTGSSSAAGQSA